MRFNSLCPNSQRALYKDPHRSSCHDVRMQSLFEVSILNLSKFPQVQILVDMYLFILLDLFYSFYNLNTHELSVSYKSFIAKLYLNHPLHIVNFETSLPITHV